VLPQQEHGGEFANLTVRPRNEPCMFYFVLYTFLHNKSTESAYTRIALADVSRSVSNARGLLHYARWLTGKHIYRGRAISRFVVFDHSE